jgi:hypothetical protein
LLTAPEDITIAPWFTIGANVSRQTNTTIAPDGTLTADTLLTSAFVSGDSIYQDLNGIRGNTPYILSVFVKAGTATSISFAAFYTGSSTEGFSINFNPITGLITGGTGTVTAQPNGWYRISFTASGTIAANTTLRWQVYLNNTGTVFVWGAQLEGGTTISDYYSVSSGIRSTIWNDISGNNFHGTLINGPTYASTNRGYLNFDHTKFQYVDFSKNPSIEFLNTSSYTLESWIRVTVNPGTGNYTGIFDREDASVGAVRDGWNILVVEQPLGTLTIVHERFAQGASATVGYVTGGTVAASVGVWFHIVATYNGSTTSLYKNGLLDSSASGITSTIKNNIKNLTIGVRGGQYFRGHIAVARIYSKALSANEVLQNFNALRGRYGI